MKQTRGALKFLLAEYRAVLKNAMLAMAMMTIASSAMSATVISTKVTVGNKDDNAQKITGTDDFIEIDNVGFGFDSYLYGNSDNDTVDYTITAKDIEIKGVRYALDAWNGDGVTRKNRITVGGDTTQSIKITQTKDNQAGHAILAQGSGTKGSDAKIFLKADSIEVTSDDSGVSAYDWGSKVSLDAKKITITAKGDSAIHTQNNHDEYKASDNDSCATVELKADTISIVNSSENGNGISAYSGSKINIEGDLEVTATNAIDTRGNSQININTNGQHKTVINGNIVFGTPGDSNSGKIINSDLNLNLTGSGSSWTGNLISDVPSTLSDAQKKVDGAKITLADGAQWNVTSVNSSDTVSSLAVNNLTLNDAVINIEDTDTTVNVDNLEGSGGTVNVAATVDTDTSDGTESLNLSTGKLIVGNVITSDEKTTKLAVNLKGVTSDDFGHLELTDIAKMAKEAVNVEKKGSSVTQTTTISEGNIRGEITATTTADATITDDDVQETIKKSEPTPSPDDVIVEKENTKHAALKAISAMNFMQWRHDMNDLNKRMGELRDSVSGVGVWARAYGSEHKYGSQNVTSKNNSIQIGSDFDVGAGWKVGGAFTYTDGDSTYTNGSADNKAYGFAVYGSWFAENGLFVDLIGKYSRMTSDYDLGNMSGDLHNNALSFSAEVGWNIPFADIAFIEPQAELSYGVIFGDNDTSSNGVHIKQDDTKTLVGRAGFRTGLHFNENKGTVYARASILHDFEGETEYFASNSEASGTFKDDLGGTYYEFGLGANYKFTSNCYSYVDLERQTHGPIAEKWRWNVGVRYVF